MDGACFPPSTVPSESAKNSRNWCFWSAGRPTICANCLAHIVCRVSHERQVQHFRNIEKLALPWTSMRLLLPRGQGPVLLTLLLLTLFYGILVPFMIVLAAAAVTREFATKMLRFCMASHRDNHLMTLDISNDHLDQFMKETTEWGSHTAPAGRKWTEAPWQKKSVDVVGDEL